MSLITKGPAIIALEETDGRSELYGGDLREKPPMSAIHNHAGRLLWYQLAVQLDRSRFEVLHDDGHLSIPGGNSYIPDVAVVPLAMVEALIADRRFEAYVDPLPLVVEIWSPSTGAYDIDAKLPGYKARGDAEIWRLHPFEQTLTMSRRRPDGSYDETTVRGGIVHLHALPDVAIDVDELFVG